MRTSIKTDLLLIVLNFLKIFDYNRDERLGTWIQEDSKIKHHLELSRSATTCSNERITRTSTTTFLAYAVLRPALRFSSDGAAYVYYDYDWHTQKPWLGGVPRIWPCYPFMLQAIAITTCTPSLSFPFTATICLQLLPQSHACSRGRRSTRCTVLLMHSLGCTLY